jgi:hypothetical protein
MAERGRGTGIVLERVDRPSHDGGAHVPSHHRCCDLDYGWPETSGITGRIAVEWVAGLPWNPHHPGDPVPDRMKWIDDAAGPPSVDDDEATRGVTIGSLWIDTANHRVYLCVDAPSGAAVWTELTGG